MYRRILAAADGTVAGFFAVDEAIGLAREQDAILRIIHVIQSVAPMISEGPNLEPLDAAWHREAENVLAYALRLAQQANVPAETALIENNRRGISAAILADAREWGANLLVLGASRHHDLRHRLIGGVVAETLAHAAVPLLVIHPPAPASIARSEV